MEIERVMVHESWYLRVAESWDLRVAESWDLRIAESWDLRIAMELKGSRVQFRYDLDYNF